MENYGDFINHESIKEYIIVIGGINIDINGYSYNKIIRQDSNPGRLVMSLGGVARNIAHNIKLLGMNVNLLTAIGEDIYTNQIYSSCKEIGIDISHALKMVNQKTSVYMAINDYDGELLVGISDMDICQYITPKYLKDNENIIQNAKAIVVDTNIPKRSIQWILYNAKPPIFVDSVSSVKVKKLNGLMDNIYTLKLNKLEAETISGIKIQDKISLDQSIDFILQSGVSRVFITLGVAGVYAADHNERIRIPSVKTDNISANGCGDAFMGGVIWAYMNEFNLYKTAISGLVASSIAIESEQNVNPALNKKIMKKRMEYIVNDKLR